MNKAVKVGAAVIGGGVLLVAAVGGGAFVWAGTKTQSLMDRTWPDIEGRDFPIPFPLTDEEVEQLRAEKAEEAAEAGEDVAEDWDPLEGVDLDAIARERALKRGTRLAVFQLGCAECHGSDGSGSLVADAMPVWQWYAPNITSGGRTKDFAARDWDRIIRHGVKRDDRNATMPAEDYARLADRDVSDIAVWVQSLPASDAVQPETVLGPVGKFLFATETLRFAVDLVDHDYDAPELPPAREATPEYGQYVAQTCVGCHRMDYTGGPIAQGDPAWPPAANLTPHEDGLKAWSKDDWMGFWTSGKRPDGTTVHEAMPWALMGQMGNTELEAMYLYLQSIDGKPTGT